MPENLYAMLYEPGWVSTVIRLGLAMLFGGIIGLERGSRRRAAGFRTYMLVCMGAALAMITNQYIVAGFPGADPARLGAQVISGIGFLGAGTIIVTRANQVIGLTTAAGLWASACIGLAVGIGFYSGALIASAFILFIMVFLRHIDRIVISRARAMDLYVEFSPEGKLSDFLQYAHESSIRVEHVQFTGPKYAQEGQQAVLVSVRLPKRHLHYEVVEAFSRVNGIGFIEEL